VSASGHPDAVAGAGHRPKRENTTICLVFSALNAWHAAAQRTPIAARQLRHNPASSSGV
jgi:hypothetical protein